MRTTVSTAIRLLVIASVAGAMLVAAPLASAFAAPNLVARIGSTKGTGPGGCVKSSKVVRFTLESDNYVLPTSARVLLDGRQIDSRSFVSFASIGSAATAPGVFTKSFDLNVSLARAKAGRHSLKLVGAFAYVPGRRAGTAKARAAGGSALVASAVSTITKCAPPKKPAFTG